MSTACYTRCVLVYHCITFLSEQLHLISSAAGIVYVFSQKDAEAVSTELQNKDILAYPYHANMDPGDKSRVHRKWTSNKIQV